MKDVFDKGSVWPGKEGDEGHIRIQCFIFGGHVRTQSNLLFLIHN